jgi:small conductance mechanosensitive channel
METPGILAEPAPFVGLKEYKASSIDYILRVWCESPDYWPVYFGLNEAVRDSFQRNGVTMTYEHINVHMVKD